MSNAPALTATAFQSHVIESSVPVLLDFGADWCGPCRMIAPFIDELATEYSGRLGVYTINVDHEPSLGSHFGVMSIPTLVIVKDGKEVDRHVGALQKAGLKAFVEKHLS